MTDATEPPDWMQRLVKATEEIDARTFTRIRPPAARRPAPASVLMLFGESE